MSEESNALVPTGDANSAWRRAYRYFREAGWSAPQAAGIVGGLRGETASLNPSQSHDRGIGIGISGWNGERRRALEEFARARGREPTDLQTQLVFVNHELKGSESKAGNALAKAENARDAGQAMLQYFRPKDFDVPGAHPERARYAEQAFKMFEEGSAGSFGGKDAPSAVANKLISPQREASSSGNLGALLGSFAPMLNASESITPKPLPSANVLAKIAQQPQGEVAQVPMAPIASAETPYIPLPKFENGKVVKLVGPNGRVFSLNPVDYDPFGGQGNG